MDVDPVEPVEAPPNGLNNPKKRPREEELLPSDDSPKRVCISNLYHFLRQNASFLAIELRFRLYKNRHNLYRI